MITALNLHLPEQSLQAIGRNIPLGYFYRRSLASGSVTLLVGDTPNPGKKRSAHFANVPYGTASRSGHSPRVFSSTVRLRIQKKTHTGRIPAWVSIVSVPFSVPSFLPVLERTLPRFYPHSHGRSDNQSYPAWPFCIPHNTPFSPPAALHIPH